MSARRHALLLLGPAALTLVVLFALPQALMFEASLGRRSAYGGIVHEWSLANYARALEPLYLGIFGRSVLLAALTTVLCLALSWPVAWWIAFRVPRRYKSALLVLLVLPFWTSFLVRMYAWIVLLRSEGVINTTLLALGLPALDLLYNDLAVLVGQVYGELPFMALPLYASMEKLDRRLLEAAADLGASPARRLLDVALPLTLPGLVAGCVLVFIPSLGAYLAPDLLGGAKGVYVGNLVQAQFAVARDAPFGAALSFVLALLVLVAVAAARRPLAAARGLSRARTLVAVLAALAPAAGAETCGIDSLLSTARIVLAHRVVGPALLTDGRLLPAGWSDATPDAVPMAAGAFVVWDLGSSREVAALSLQASAGARFRVLVSDDGDTGRAIWEAGPVAGTGVVERWSDLLQARGRLLRLEAVTAGSVTELRVFCERREPFPPPGAVDRALPRRPLVEAVQSARVARTPVLVVAGLILAFGAPRLRRRARVTAAWLLCVVGAAAWLQFGLFTAPALVHRHDATHYFLGSKYASELGHVELYRCIARAEMEAGRSAALSDSRVRDLETYTLRPATWFLDPGRCRAPFTAARWREFRVDVDALRAQLGDYGLRAVLRDHGYNATPVQTLWLGAITGWMTASLPSLRVLATLDLLAVAATIGVFGWGFGPRAAALVALVIGGGAPWGYEWVGGSIGRFGWLLLLAVGLASARRERYALAGAALAGAGLLRLWPFVFLAGLGVWALLQSVRARQVLPAARRAAIGASLVIVLGVGATLARYGVESWTGFARKMQSHQGHVSVNQLGLPVLLSASAQRSLDSLRAPELDDPDDLWRQSHRHAREAAVPLTLAVAGLGAALVAWAGWRRTNPVEAIALCGLPLWALLGLSAYDYVWLVALVPLCARRAPWAAALLATVALSALLRQAFSFELEHALLNLALAVLLPAVGVAATLRGWPARRLGPTSAK